MKYFPGFCFLAALCVCPAVSPASPDGEFTVYIPERGKRTEHEKGISYNDHFHVLWDEARRMYYAFWTQGSWEGAGDHHIVFSRSADRGRTWTAPKFLRDRDGGRAYLHPRSPCPIYDWKGPESGSGRYFAFIHGTFDFENSKSAWQTRGPVYLISGTFDADAEQPIRFSAPKLFLDRRQGNAFYTSYTVADGVGVLWYPDCKRDLRGRVIDDKWMEEER